MYTCTYELEQKFPKLSRARKVASRAKLGHLNFQAETELTSCTSIRSKFLLNRNLPYFVLLS